MPQHAGYLVSPEFSSKLLFGFDVGITMLLAAKMQKIVLPIPSRCIMACNCLDIVYKFVRKIET